MNRDEALSTAQAAANRFGKVFVLYRLPAWPTGVYGVVAEDRDLPPQADISTRLVPFGAPTPAAPQGSLF